MNGEDVHILQQAAYPHPAVECGVSDTQKVGHKYLGFTEQVKHLSPVSELYIFSKRNNGRIIAVHHSPENIPTLEINLNENNFLSLREMAASRK